MSNEITANSNQFNIWDYIDSNLEKDYLKGKVVICMNVDDNYNPYIEVSYIDESCVELGLTKSYNVLDNKQLSSLKEYALKYKSLFKIPTDEEISSIIYSFKTGNLNLVKYKDGQYTGNKFYNENDDFFVGYIIDKNSNISYTYKVEKLYEFMKDIMLRVDRDMAKNVIFKVKEKYLQNIYFIKDWRKGYLDNENLEYTDEENMRIIASEYHIELDDKIKKL